MFRFFSNLFFTMMMIIVVLGLLVVSMFNSAIFKLVLAMIITIGVSVVIISIYVMKDE